MSNGFANMFGTRNNQQSGSGGPVSFFLSASNPQQPPPQPVSQNPPQAQNEQRPSQTATSFFRSPQPNPEPQQEQPKPAQEERKPPAEEKPQPTRYFGSQAAQVTVNNPNFVPIVGAHTPPTSGGFFGGANKSGGSKFFEFAQKKEPEEPPKTEPKPDEGAKDNQSGDRVELKPVELKDDQRVRGLFDDRENRQDHGQASDRNHMEQEGPSTPPRRSSPKDRGSDQSTKQERKKSDAAADFLREIEQIDNDLGTINGEILTKPLTGILSQDKGKETPHSKRVYFDEEAISMSNKKESEGRLNRAHQHNLPGNPQGPSMNETDKDREAHTRNLDFFGSKQPKENPTVEENAPKPSETQNTEANPGISSQPPTQQEVPVRTESHIAPANFSAMFAPTTANTNQTATGQTSRLPPSSLLPQAPPLSTLAKPPAARTTPVPAAVLTEQKQAFATLIQRARKTLARNREARVFRENAYLEARAVIGKKVDIGNKVVALQATASRDCEFIQNLEEFVAREIPVDPCRKALDQTKKKVAELEAGLESAGKYLEHLKLIKSNLENELNIHQDLNPEKKLRVLQELMQPRKYAPTTLSTYSFGGLLGNDQISTQTPKRFSQNSLFGSTSPFQSVEAPAPITQSSVSTSQVKVLPSKQTTTALATLDQLSKTAESTLQSLENLQRPQHTQPAVSSGYKRALQKRWHTSLHPQAVRSHD